MKLNRSIIFAILFASFSLTAVAGGESGTKSISEVYVNKDGIRIKSEEGDWNNPDN